MSKFTQGPWAAHFTLNNKRLGLGEWCVTGGPNKLPLPGTHFNQCSRGREEASANACLIASAPDLLSACEAALDYLGGWPADSEQRATRDRVKAAIAKAKGVK